VPARGACRGGPPLQVPSGSLPPPRRLQPPKVAASWASEGLFLGPGLGLPPFTEHPVQRGTHTPCSATTPSPPSALAPAPPPDWVRVPRVPAARRAVPALGPWRPPPRPSQPLWPPASCAPSAPSPEVAAASDMSHSLAGLPSARPPPRPCSPAPLAKIARGQRLSILAARLGGGTDPAFLPPPSPSPAVSPDRDRETLVACGGKGHHHASCNARPQAAASPVGPLRPIPSQQWRRGGERSLHPCTPQMHPTQQNPISLTERPPRQPVPNSSPAGSRSTRLLGFGVPRGSSQVLRSRQRATGDCPCLDTSRQGRASPLPALRHASQHKAPAALAKGCECGRAGRERHGSPLPSCGPAPPTLAQPAATSPRARARVEHHRRRYQDPPRLVWLGHIGAGCPAQPAAPLQSG